MTSAPKALTETPGAGEADPVDEILSAMHLSGGVFIDAEARGNWSIASHFLPDQCAMFFPVTGSLIGYHYMVEGEMWTSVEGEPPQRAGPGSVVIFPRNDPHRVYSADLPPISSQNLLDLSDPRGVVRLRAGDDGTLTRFFCGFLSTSSDDNLLLERLPRLLVLDPATNLQSDWVESSMRFATEAALPASDVGRLAELLVRQTLRDLLRRLADDQPQWLNGLRDRFVARALAIIHRRYAEELDVETLAREVGLSRSALSERFVTVLGEPPMRYCARWRMRQAARLLRETDTNTASVAYAVGFNSEAAFNRAFKREYGEPPATWRKRKGGQMTPGRPLDFGAA